MTTFQYRLIIGKKDERVAGPERADVVVTVPLATVVEPDFDAAVAYMQGALKSAGPTAPLLDALKSGEVTAALRGLAGHSG